MDSFEREYKMDTLDEINDNLSELSNVTQEIESGQPGENFIDEIFRIYHNIKGNAKSANFSTFSDLAHSVEDLLLKVKNGEYTLNQKLMGVIYESHSLMSDAIDKLKTDLETVFDFSAFYEQLKETDFLTEADNGEEASEASKKEDFDPNAIQVLITDDEEDIAELIEIQIKDQYNAQIHRALNGEEALKLCENQKFDVIITDFFMPVMSGLDFIKNLRHSHFDNSQTPILMITGHKPDLTPDEGAFEKVFFLEKPITFSNFSFVFKCALKFKKAS